MALTIDDLFISPDHYLQCFEGNDALFLQMDRAAYNRSIFLDARISPAGSGVMKVPAAAFATHDRRRQRMAWIFHVAHCGSTLLARALDDVTANLVLREPLALRQLALTPDADRAALVLRMLGKRYAATRPTLIKANVPVNFFLPALAAYDGEAAAIFLYLGLEPYLTAILRSDNHRAWLRRVTSQLARHLGDLSQLGDGACAAALWVAQIRAFEHAIMAMPNARALDAERFFADPHTALTAATRQLEISIRQEVIAARVAGPLFATYSKNPAEKFDESARKARQAEVRAAISSDLDDAYSWLDHKGINPKVVVQALNAAPLL